MQRGNDWLSEGDFSLEHAMQSITESLFYSRAIDTWQVSQNVGTEKQNGVLLGDAGEPTTNGAWEIQTPDPQGRGIYGPYIDLQANSYRATFRLKINDNTGEDQRLVVLDVTSRKAFKYFAQKTITVRDFVKSNEYQDFILHFDVFNADKDFEFRVRTNRDFESKRRVTLANIKLSVQEKMG